MRIVDLKDVLWSPIEQSNKGLLVQFEDSNSWSISVFS